jgi:hypothetical protein
MNVGTYRKTKKNCLHLYNARWRQLQPTQSIQHSAWGPLGVTGSLIIHAVNPKSCEKYTWWKNERHSNGLLRHRNTSLLFITIRSQLIWILSSWKFTLPSKAQWLLYVPPRLTFNNSTFCPHSVFMRWRSWLRHCATSRKVAGSIPDGVIGFFHWHNPFGRTMALGSTQPLTKMRSISWGVKAAGAQGWKPYHLHVPIVYKSVSLNLLEP